MPPQPDQWETEQKRARRLYQQLVDEYWLDPRIFDPEKGTPQSMLELSHKEGLADAAGEEADVEKATDPMESIPKLSRPKGMSEWTAEDFEAKLAVYQKDEQLRFEVHKDVVRTHPVRCLVASKE